MRLQTPETLRTFQRTLYIKAKAEPVFRFYSLYDKVYRRDILRHAYERVRHNGGAPGVDRETFEDIAQQGEAAWVDGLQDALREKTYSPSPVRQVSIPKPHGGERPVGIPTIRDRVVQMAALLVLEPIFEADFLDGAHGYRRQHRAKEAVQAVHGGPCARGRQEWWMRMCRHTIPHEALMQSIARRVSDGAMLANIYMHRFLRYWYQCGMPEKRRATIVNYADDCVMLTRGYAEEALEWTRKVMSAIGLALNEEKTCIREATRESFDFLGYTFGSEYYRKDGQWYLSAKPSRTAIHRLKRAVRECLKGPPRPWGEIAESLSRVLQGWANYFSYGTRFMAYRAMDNYVYTTVVTVLSKRHKCTGRNGQHFPPARLFGELGVQRLQSLLRS